MRKEAVYTVILNVTLFSGMKCFIAQDSRYIRLSVIEDGVTIHYNLRVSCFRLYCFHDICSDLLAGFKREDCTRFARGDQVEYSSLTSRVPLCYFTVHRDHALLHLTLMLSLCTTTGHSLLPISHVHRWQGASESWSQMLRLGTHGTYIVSDGSDPKALENSSSPRT